MADATVIMDPMKEDPTISTEQFELEDAVEGSSSVDYKERIARTLRKTRQLANITQEEMGRLLAPYMGRDTAVNKAQISAIERGLNKATVEIILGYCEICEVTPDTIFLSILNDDYTKLIKARLNMFPDPLFAKIYDAGDGLERIAFLEEFEASLEQLEDENNQLKRGRPAKKDAAEVIGHIYKRQNTDDWETWESASSALRTAVYLTPNKPVRTKPLAKKNNTLSLASLIKDIMQIPDAEERKLALKILAQES